MYTSKKMKNCSNFQPIDSQSASAFSSSNHICKDCAYFSSRNCHMDVADSIEPMLNMFR